MQQLLEAYLRLPAGLTLASQGKRKSAAAAEESDPKTTENPKRWVGGKAERKKMPNPEQMMIIEVAIGCQSRERARPQTSQVWILLPRERRAKNKR